MKRRISSLALALTVALGLVVPAGAAEYPRTFKGDVMLAVNSSVATGTVVEGSFTVDEEKSVSLMALEEDGGIYDVWADPDTGEELTILAPVLEMPEPVLDQNGDEPLLSVQAAAGYQVDSTFSLKSQYCRKGTAEEETMVCVHVGTYCTVWTSISDPEAIRLSAEQGAAIGAYFDEHYSAMVSAFGQPHDADGDGRVAIMCYDLSDQFVAGVTVTSYTAGYFYGADMIDTSGKVNGVNYGSGSHINGLDCIHIDTYPTMGNKLENPLSNISNCYSTLFHEFQHMINYSHQVKNGAAGYVIGMETYLDEAFAMAAEHLICGEETTQTRVDFFNSSYSSSKYVAGTPLTYWRAGDKDATNAEKLSSYSNSFLFGQYMRTRYGQLKGNDGSTLYKTVLESRTEENENDTLGIITDLLQTTKEQLILDFWAAVYCKAPSGVYGFAGETWADAIEPVVESGFANTAGIYNGGVKYYLPGEEGCTVTASQDVTLMTLSLSGGSDVQMVCRETAGQTTLQVEAWGKGARTAAVILYSSDGRMMGLEWLELTNERVSHLVETRGLRMQMLMLGEGVSPLCSALSH